VAHGVDVSSPPWVALRSDALWISLCLTYVNYRGRSGRSDSEEGHSLESDSFVTWRDAVGHIHRRWAHVRTQKIAVSTRGEGTETAGGVRDVVLHPQSRNSFEASKRSVISTCRWYLFPARRKQL
jgi:hypothetical protein